MDTRDKSNPPHNLIGLLDELRAIAQLGLHYTKDPFDRERYERLLELSAGEYAKLSDISAPEIMDRFRAELGHVTPKVGVDAAIFSDEGRLLLTRRFDDEAWCLPCGWAEVGETPRQSLARELREETGAEVEVRSVIDVFTRLPGAFGSPHTTYHILFHCVHKSGRWSTSPEVLEVGFFDHTAISDWHKDHEERAHKAHEFWFNLGARSSPSAD